jgi:polysaccharide export outer membrane protein
VIKLPLLGRVVVAGLTVKEAEKLLEEKYSVLYVDPYVSLKITNKRIIIFPGNGGSARVLNLTNNNTTIMEAIANAGGILEDGKAYKVKLIRSNPEPGKKPFVYLMDLSTISGIKAGSSIAQAGDIIYVEPRYRPLATFNREVTPIVSLLTSLFLLYQFAKIK